MKFNTKSQFQKKKPKIGDDDRAFFPLLDVQSQEEPIYFFIFETVSLECFFSVQKKKKIFIKLNKMKNSTLYYMIDFSITFISK
jgi:hypothetical protein